MTKTKLGDFKIIAIYQYGKVGSATLGTNICKWLNTPFGGTITKIQTKYSRVVHLHDPKIMCDILSKYDRVLIINACRNFYDRQISEFFQQHKNREKIKTLTLEELSSELSQNSIFRLNDWYQKFETNILNGSKLESFDYQKHYSLTQHIIPKKINTRCQVSVLLIRLEDSKHWEKIFQQVVHPKIKFKSSTNKTKGVIYQQFKEHFKYSLEETTKLAESDTHQRYYQDLDRLNLILPITE